MKKLFILFYSVIINCSAQAQSAESYKLVNDIISQLIDSNFSSFYLVESIPNLDFKDNYLANLKMELKELIPFEALTEIYTKSKNDSIPKHWKNNLISKAFILDNKELSNKYILIKKDWQEAEEKHRKYLGLSHFEYAKLTTEILDSTTSFKDYLSLNPEEQQIYFIGNPIFSSDFQYAIFVFASSQARQATTEFKCLVKNIGGKWTLIKKFDWSAS